ncbi:MAG TPA: LptA/OstA family protein [Candidatus Cloacimonadota bacterium]|nr:LptA/OstA family protein [Candidatus Cloacimonadota bacterium]HPT72815.1 LptA/OstA family protein [Candidatus Cloacimonadota bacterium]
MKKILIGSILLYLIFSLPAAATPAKTDKQTQSSQDTSYRLINADHLFLSKVNNEYITELLGNVHFFYGEAEFWTNRSLIWEKQKVARMEGNVKVKRDTLYLEADSVVYYRSQDKMNLGSHVYVKETHPDKTIRTFRASNAEYHPREKRLICQDSVAFYDQREKMYGTCGYFLYKEKDGYGYLMKDPVVYATGKDSIRISSDKMEYFRQFSKLIATFNVKANTSDYQATSDFLIYLNHESKAVFTGSPRFYSSFGNAQAVNFYLYFDNRELKRAVLEDSCIVNFSEEEGKTPTDWCRAKYITMFFENREIRRFDAESDVSYHYVQEQTDKKDYANNDATGAHLTITFKPDNKVDIMKMEKQIKGKYKFKNNKT